MRFALALSFATLLYIEVKGGMNGSAFLVFAVVAILVMTPVFFVGKVAKRKDEEVYQRARDQRLQREAETLHLPDGDSGEVLTGRDFEIKRRASAKGLRAGTTILYLRPFLIDTEFKLQNPRKDSWVASIIPFYRLMQQDHLTFDDAIRLTLRRYGELVAIGSPETTIGATRLRVGDDEWKSQFWMLSLEASFIIIFPGPRSGTLWEMGAIRSDPALLTKTIFMMPYVEAEFVSESYPSLDEVKQLLGKLGLSAPLDLQMGDALLFDDSGALVKRAQVIKSGWLGPYLAYRDLKAVAAVARTQRCAQAKGRPINPHSMQDD